MNVEWINDVSKNVMIKISDIVKVWQLIGVADEKFIARSDSLKQHVYTLLDDMLEEEKQHMIDLESSVKHLNEEISMLCNDLKICPKVNIPSEHSLVKNESQLLLIKEDLARVKNNRIESYHKMIDMEKEICERLFEYRAELNPKLIPSEYELDELKAHINGLQNLQAKRQESFCSKRCKILEIYKLLDKPVPKDAIIQKIFDDSNGDYVPLSKDFLSDCDRIITKLLDEWEINKAECIKLRSRYAILFNILYSAKSDAIYSSYAYKESDNYGLKTLEMLRYDVLHLEQLRLEKMEEFIKNYKFQIREKMNKNLLSHFQEMEPHRSMLNSLQNDEELLQKLEHELDFFNEIEKQVSPIVKEINNWEGCFAKLNELKLKLKDPVVLKNRGGILLKVEKEKNAVQKELPKSETKIGTLLSSFKSDIINADDLLIDNMRVLDYLMYQWNHVDGEKENDKKMTSKSDATKSIMSKSTLATKKAPLVNINSNVTPLSKMNKFSQSNDAPSSKLITNTMQSRSIPVKVYESVVKKTAFRIPQLKKPQTKEQRPISPINKVLKKVHTTLDRRVSRSCTDLTGAVKSSRVNISRQMSNSHLYGMFCRDIEPGIATSSFIEQSP